MRINSITFNGVEHAYDLGQKFIFNGETFEIVYKAVEMGSRMTEYTAIPVILL